MAALPEVIKINCNTSLGYVQQTVGAAAAALSTIPANATRAFIHNETQPIRIRLDATNPTSAVGFLLPLDTYLFLEGIELLTKARVIRQGGTDSLVSIHYFS